MMRAADNAAIRSAIGLGQTDAPTFLGLSVTGQSLISNGTATNPAIAFASNLDTGMRTIGGADLRFTVDGFDAVSLSQSQISIQSGFASISLGTGVGEVILARDGAANILAQRNGTAKQVHRVYNTFLGTTANEWGGFDWLTTANTLRIGTEHGGTGAARPIDFVTGGVVRMTIQSGGNISIPNGLFVTGNIIAGYLLKLTALTVATLPAAASNAFPALVGVSDATMTAALGKGTTVVGGGANKVIVMSDGTNWVIL
jgi:hypothetical protein